MSPCAGRRIWLLAWPLVAVWSCLLDGAFIGTTRSREMRDSMLVPVTLVYLPAWYLARPLGNHGLWLAFLLFNAARGLTLGWLLWRVTRAGRGWLTRPHPGAMPEPARDE